MVLLIDNYDSFSYNLYQYLSECAEVLVIKNDELSAEQILALKPERVIISPGPCRPSEAGVIEQAVLRLSGVCPVLGVCLGHQAIAEAYGGKITYAKKLMHGKADKVNIIRPCPLFKGLEATFTAARYHSLAVERESLPDSLIITAEADDGEIMALRHKEFPLFGVQFHPESILTPGGKDIIKNFIKI